MVATVMTQPQVLEGRRFFTWMALVLAVTMVVGFGPTYFLAAWNDGPKPVITAAVHIHGALCTAWVLLFLVQTGLIAAQRRDLHRIIGVGGSLIAVATVAAGIFVALHSQRRVHTAATADTFADPYVFVMFPLGAVSAFGVFALLGIAYRGRRDIHRRMMLFATVSLVTPAIARIVRQFMQVIAPGETLSLPTPVGGMLLANLFIVALALHDLRTERRLHPATLWGGGLLILSGPLRVMFAFTQPWQDFARMLMS